MVLRTFSPARAWRPAVVARLARTLGVMNLPLLAALLLGTTSALANPCVKVAVSLSPDARSSILMQMERRSPPASYTTILGYFESKTWSAIYFATAYSTPEFQIYRAPSVFQKNYRPFSYLSKAEPRFEMETDGHQFPESAPLDLLRCLKWHRTAGRILETSFYSDWVGRVQFETF